MGDSEGRRGSVGVGGGRWGPAGMSRAVFWKSPSGRRHGEDTPGRVTLDTEGVELQARGPRCSDMSARGGGSKVIAKVKLSANNEQGTDRGRHSAHGAGPQGCSSLRPVITARAWTLWGGNLDSRG